MGSIYNGKRVGDMTFDEVRAVAFQWIIVKKKCDRMTIIDIKNDGSERCIVTFSKEDFL